jgi:aquaporin Z
MSETLAPALQHRNPCWLLVLSGLVTLLVGFLIAIQWPVSAFWVLGTFLGIDLLFYGFSLLNLYFVVRRKREPFRRKP